MAADASAGGNRRHPVVLDFTRIDNLNDTKRIFLNIRDDYAISVLVNDGSIRDYIFDSQNTYNLYGYMSIDFKGNNDINYAIDLARMDKTYLDKKTENRYSNYKYANHYPVPMSNWNKFSRFKLDYLEYSRIASIKTHDFYSLLSIFDSINQYRYHNFLSLDNSNYKDFNTNNPDSIEYVDKPVEYHGRNIYIDKNFIYLKVNGAADVFASNVVASKYMAVELDGSTKSPVKLKGIFALCNTHAYIVNSPTNKLDLMPEYLLSCCNATKFGDISDERTILNLTNVKDISGLCNFSKVEDLSMHTIKMDRSAEYITMAFAFQESKIKKLPAGFVESLSGGFKNLSAIDAFKNAKNIELDISKINIPTLGSAPSNYNLTGMYKGSNCRHINRSIVAKNDKDRINSERMYEDTTLIEDSPLPDGMFKRYTPLYHIFDGVTFETADSFKYIYSEFTKSADFTNASLDGNTKFSNIIIKNNINGHKVIIGSGSDYSKTRLASFTDYGDDSTTNSEPLRLSIMGKLYADYYRRITVVGVSCKELSFGSRLSDLKEAAKAGFNDGNGKLVHYYIYSKFKEFADVIKNEYNYSTNFFYSKITPADHQVFRRLSMLIGYDDYYKICDYLFKGVFQYRYENNSFVQPTYNITSILHSVTTKDVDMLSLDEIKDTNFITPIITKQYYSACAIINTNGKNLKWTLARKHKDEYSTAKTELLFNIPRYYAFLSVFTSAIYLYRAIKAQMYFTSSFMNEKIEFVFKANDEISLFRFLAVMSLYMDPNDPQKAVGRYLLIYNGTVYDSKTDMNRINTLATTGKIQEYVREINENRDMYDDGFVDEV